VVFVSYSREDAEWRRKFVEMLKPVVREWRLEVWCDERNLVGYEWRPQLAEAIGRSRAALLLVSPSFLASDFIMQQELPALIERGVHLVCVLVRPCLWEQVGALERVQWAHDPNRDGPVASSDDAEGQIVRVCKKLLDLLIEEAYEKPGSAIDVGAQIAVPSTRQTEPLGAGGRAGELYEVPPLPATFVAREELAGLREAVLRAGEGAVGITGKALGLQGEGGIGKTVLAAALARDDVVRRHFPDGVFWVTVGERGDLVAAQIELLAKLGVGHPDLRSASQGLELLRGGARRPPVPAGSRRCLVDGSGGGISGRRAPREGALHDPRGRGSRGDRGRC